MKKIIIQTPLNTMGFSYARETDPEWLNARTKIMEDYTSTSLGVQTDQNFEWHVLTRMETKERLENSFKSKFSKTKILLPGESDKLIIEAAEDIANDPNNLLLLIRLNSDDCYQKRFIQVVQNFVIKPGTEALVFQYGFMWYQKQNIIVERNFPSPPFYAFIYNPMEYLMGKRYNITGHNYIRKELQTHALKERLWLWLVNDYNNKILRGSSYPDPKDYFEVPKNVLKEFGLPCK